MHGPKITKAELAIRDALDSRLPIEPNVYLDHRRTEWAEHERAGRIKYERAKAELRPLVYVVRELEDVLAILDWLGVR